MSLEGFEPLDGDDACRLMGAFRRKAHEQGWSEAALERACRGVSARRAFAELERYIEAAEPEPLSWRTQFQRTRDYVKGCRLLADDREADFNPVHFLARSFKIAFRHARRPAA